MFRTMPRMQKQHIYKFILGACVIGVGIWLLVSGGGKNGIRTATTTPNMHATSTDATSTTVSIGGIDINVPSGATITEISSGADSTPPPTLDRSVTFPDFYTDEQKTIVEKKMNDTIQALKNDPTQFAYWLELGILRSNVQDYEGAKEVYEYLNAVSPNNSISFMNLGNLYYLYLKDYMKAEGNFKHAITNNPNNMQAYQSLYELYTNAYKQNTDSGLNTLLEALSVMPNNVDFLRAVGMEYKKRGDTAHARTYLEKARDEAQKLDNQGLVDTLEQELSSL